MMMEKSEKPKLNSKQKKKLLLLLLWRWGVVSMRKIGDGKKEIPTRREELSRIFLFWLFLDNTEFGFFFNGFHS